MNAHSEMSTHHNHFIPATSGSLSGAAEVPGFDGGLVHQADMDKAARDWLRERGSNLPNTWRNQAQAKRHARAVEFRERAKAIEARRVKP